MRFDTLSINRSALSYKTASDSYLGMSQNAKKLGLKEEQTIEKNESRYDLDGTLKEEHLPIGSSERAKKKEEELKRQKQTDLSQLAEDALKAQENEVIRKLGEL